MDEKILENVAEILESDKNVDDAPATSEAVVEESVQEQVAKEIKEEVIEDAPKPAEEKKESVIDTMELAQQVKELKGMVEKIQMSESDFNKSIEDLKSEVTKMFFNGTGSPVAEEEKIDVVDLFDDEFVKKF